MRCSAVSGLMMAVLIGDAVAGPVHGHLHKRAHQKKSVDWESLDWKNMDIDWEEAYANGKAGKTGYKTDVPTSSVEPAAVPTPYVAAAPASAPEVAPAKVSPVPATYKQSSTPAKKVSDLVSDGYAVSSALDDLQDLFNGVEGCANKITSFGEVVASNMVTGPLTIGDKYVGNYGNPYGHNVMKVDSKSGYDFTNTFINTGSETITINLWNKVGPDLMPQSGPSLAPKNTTLTFVLKPGESQTVAIQENSQVAWAQATDNYHMSGAFAESWGEANFVPTGSGYNLSAIMSSGGNNYDMTISSEEVECVSDRTQNFWLKEYTPIGGSDGSCYVPGKTMHLTTKMGGHVPVS
ncbi:uncharacterized protein L3040_007609 [Drepanopeziza brunnea f. sp. 'multigermtubi']|uniref:Allergen Asp f 4 n=1 Tax=Marssonina brunnea f. sp. multigermtubi (strain MB_m1) TaxID=1072389 RepID=K1WKN7_MARBU|nr:allergen Asp f 4 [Drepanopeziza brunnea f. sp. 'multigermtubi' MB_m1]EKD18220.1 allergen Asp f 4 [Drepanopeziza brunnea f. sp. 'multigermtubi' MB_m1]KAJ5037434.1 hypothetical protein L3040_007609 [Drepanopeziza brunnea f. sp. 'multigermtubi']